MTVTKKKQKKATKPKKKSVEKKVEEFIEKLPERGYAFMKGIIIDGAEKTVKPMTKKELKEIRKMDEDSLQRMI